VSPEGNRHLGHASLQECLGDQLIRSALKRQLQDGVLFDQQVARNLVWLVLDDATETSS
jgi:hypothetical protein